MASVRIQRVKNEGELEDKIRDYLVMGYEIKRRYDNGVELWKKNNGGISYIIWFIIWLCLFMLNMTYSSILLFIITICSFILFVNFMYKSHFSPEDAVLLKIDKNN